SPITPSPWPFPCIVPHFRNEFALSLTEGGKMKALKAFVLGLAMWGFSGQGQAQIIGQPYYYHYGYGFNAYGWGYTPIISGVWYWPYYGLAYPSWTTWGYSYYYNN